MPTAGSTVYIVEHGSYEAKGVTEVKSSLRGAFAAADLNDDPAIHEWTVDGDEQRSAWYGVSTGDTYQSPPAKRKWYGELAEELNALEASLDS